MHDVIDVFAYQYLVTMADGTEILTNYEPYQPSGYSKGTPGITVYEKIRLNRTHEYFWKADVWFNNDHVVFFEDLWARLAILKEQ